MGAADELVRDSRRKAGLTQVGLARAMGISQAAVARLERPGANPTVGTLRRTLTATGHALELSASRRSSSVDLVQLLQQMKLSPEERLSAHQVAHDNMRELLDAMGRDR